MNRQEFMKKLEVLLQGIPASEREDALAYYNDYFDEAGAENEYQVVLELGSPEAVAEKILADLKQESEQWTGQGYHSYDTAADADREWRTASSANPVPKEKKKMSKSAKILLIILLVLTCPLWIGLVAGLFGIVVGLLGAIFGITVGGVGAALGLLVGGIGCIIVGIARFLFAPAESLATIGVGAILTAVGLLLALLCIWCVGVWIPKLVKAIAGWIKGLIHRRKEGNEV